MGIHKGRIEKPFTITPAVIARDPDLGLKERGMLTTLYSLPEDWRFSVEGMAKVLKDGVSSVKATLIQLEKKGYVERRRNRTKEGWYSDEELYLKLPLEIANAPPGSSPSVDFPPVVNPPEVPRPEEKPLEGKRGESNKHRSNIKEYEKKYIASPARKNRFNNFPQREYDFPDIERKLLASQNARWKTSEPEAAGICTSQKTHAVSTDDAETKERLAIQNLEYEEQGSSC